MAFQNKSHQHVCALLRVYKHVSDTHTYMYTGETDCSVHSHAGLRPSQLTSCIDFLFPGLQRPPGNQTPHNITAPTVLLPYHYVTCLQRHSNVTCSKRELRDGFCLNFVLRHLQLTKRMHLIRSRSNQHAHIHKQTSHTWRNSSTFWQMCLFTFWVSASCFYTSVFVWIKQTRHILLVSELSRCWWVVDFIMASCFQSLC